MRSLSIRSSFLVLLFLFSKSLCAIDASELFPRFVENKGQWPVQVLYKLSLQNGAVYIERDGITYDFWSETDYQHYFSHGAPHSADSVKKLRCHAYKVEFEGANPLPRIEHSGKSTAVENFFLGKDPRNWASNVHSYSTVVVKDIYPGIDLQVYSNAAGIKYDLLIQPGVDPSVIQLVYKGVQPVLDEKGNLRIHTSVNDLEEEKPLAYTANSKTILKDCRYVLLGNKLTFQWTRNSLLRKESLIIDPQVVFSTYSGSRSDNFGFTATYDTLGNGYLGGRVYGTQYPVTVGAYDRTYNGASSGYDIAISKFNSDGTQLMYATYVGGAAQEQPHSMIVDQHGNLFVFGRSNSIDFPVSVNCAQSTNAGGYDLVVFKLDSTGSSLLASTYIGGSDLEGINITTVEDDYYTGYSLKYNYSDDARGEVNLDSENNVYIASNTRSPDVPTLNAIQGVLKGSQDAYILKLDSSLQQIKFATYLGGGGDDAAYALEFVKDTFYVVGGTSSSDLPFTAGTIKPTYSGFIDGFLGRFYETTTMNASLTYLGSSAYDQCYFVHPDKAGDIYVFGQTRGASPIFPSTVYSNANSGQFLQKISPDLKTVLLSTVVGSGRGVPDISPTAFTVDTCGRIFFSGWGGMVTEGAIDNGLSTQGLPISSDAYQSTTDTRDLYFMVLGPNAESFLYGTYFGGPSNVAEHVDGGTSRFDDNGVIYQSVCAGCGGQSSFPSTPGVYSTTNKSNNCNNALVKFDTRPIIDAKYSAAPRDVCDGTPVQFNNLVPGNLNFHWDFGDMTSSTSKSPSHLYAGPGVYYVTLTILNAGCTVGKSVFKDSVRVFSYSKINAGKDTVVCPGEPFTLTATGSSSIQWTPATGLSTPSSPSSTGVTSTSRLYIAENPNPGQLCFMRDSVFVKVEPRFYSGVTALADTVCVPDKAVLYAKYHSANAAYVWKDGSTVLSTVDSMEKQITLPGNYMFRLVIKDDSTCNNADSTDVPVVAYPAFELQLPDSVYICIGDTSSVMVNSNFSPVSYSWSPSTNVLDPQSAILQSYATISKLYTVTGLIHQCKTQDSVYVGVKEYLQAEILSTIDTSCIPFSSTLTAKIIPSADAYKWMLKGLELSQNTGLDYTFNQAGNFSFALVASNAATCFTSDTAYRIISALDRLPLKSDTLFKVCERDTTGFIDLRLPFGNVSYQWGGDSIVFNADSSLVRFIGKDFRQYNLNAVFKNCMADLKVTVEAIPLLNPNFSVNKELCGDTYFFADVQNARSYVWDLGDGTQLQEANVTHFFKDTGTYVVSLYASGDSANHCPNRIVKQLKIESSPEQDLQIPNVFTPDNDGVNDVFEIVNAGVNCTPDKVFIYSRWGDKVYEGDADQYWDGKWKGVLVPDGTYYYVIRMENGGKLSGYVTVLAGGR